MNYTVVVGLEVHVQLLTASKLFCACANKFNPDNPNVQTCPVCLGLPGSLPVMNRKAFELSLKTAMALDCGIARFTKWDRKQYYYPDLPKAYQISQYDLPYSHDGHLDVKTDDGEGVRRVGIIRVHLEEDAGKNMHDESGRGQDSQVDLNRCGTPLMEIVSEPDIRTPGEARRFLEEMKLLLTYIGVSDCNMQEGSLRCDANINLHIPTDDGGHVATPIVEVKNMNSIRNVELALEYETTRQFREFQETGVKLGDPGGNKVTRGWDANRNVSFEQRGKEEASDYRYFPDPDLVPVTVTEEQLDAIRGETCELPTPRRARFQSEFGLSEYDASVIIDQGPALADYFETVAQGSDGKQAANWVTQDVLREMNERKVDIDEFAIRPDVLSSILKRVTDAEITIKSGREVFAALLADADADIPISIKRIDRIIEERGLKAVSAAGELEGIIATVIERNAQAANDFRNGKQAAIGRLIGEVMRECKGADAKAVRAMLVDELSK
ncbi:MAG: Asp-tRNA(Asn)/Glu-tRNA(Gln) amidotransferase subunit GatB [Planctomycetota bacterium]|nr:Asp-tRNA(Asn)/Glu-tRNA(Gln) amidotransferase subunit GatB [Planctomycetota bacterium]